MRHSTRSITITRPTAQKMHRGGFNHRKLQFSQKGQRQKNQRSSRRVRGLHTYWAELGFVLMAVFFLKPEWVQTVVAAVTTASNVTTIAP